jgi:hypothetical protein
LNKAILLLFLNPPSYFGTCGYVKCITRVPESRPGFWKIKNIEKEDEQAKINYSKIISMNKHNTKIILSLNLLLLIQAKYYNYIFYLHGTKKKNLVCPILLYRSAQISFS